MFNITLNAESLGFEYNWETGSLELADPCHDETPLCSCGIRHALGDCPEFYDDWSSEDSLAEDRCLDNGQCLCPRCMSDVEPESIAHLLSLHEQSLNCLAPNERQRMESRLKDLYIIFYVDGGSWQETVEKFEGYSNMELEEVALFKCGRM